MIKNFINHGWTRMRTDGEKFLTRIPRIWRESRANQFIFVPKTLVKSVIILMINKMPTPELKRLPAALEELEKRLLRSVDALEAGKGVEGKPVARRLRKRIKEAHSRK